MELKWEYTDAKLRTPHGVYWISQMAPEWFAARFLPAKGGEIEFLGDENGDDWKTFLAAELACSLHYEALRKAKSADDTQPMLAVVR